jgi:hypothetical protein
LPVFNFVALRGTGGNASPAADAKFRMIDDFRFKADGFRIMAPQALERTAFHENGRPDSRTVVDRKMLYIGNQSL